MNQTELYFARQNFLWKFQVYFLIALLIFSIVMLIIAWIYDWWKWRKPRRRKK